MTSPHDHELTHPLEQVTGEKDVPPEEENSERRPAETGAEANEGDDSAQGAGDAPGGEAS